MALIRPIQSGSDLTSYRYYLTGNPDSAQWHFRDNKTGSDISLPVNGSATVEGVTFSATNVTVTVSNGTVSGLSLARTAITALTNATSLSCYNAYAFNID